ncbi:hypothetical protein ACHAPO_000120 [Fusarium lateritium]
MSVPDLSLLSGTGMPIAEQTGLRSSLVEDQHAIDMQRVPVRPALDRCLEGGGWRPGGARGGVASVLAGQTEIEGRRKTTVHEHPEKNAGSDNSVVVHLLLLKMRTTTSNEYLDVVVTKMFDLDGGLSQQIYDINCHLALLKGLRSIERSIDRPSSNTAPIPSSDPTHVPGQHKLGGLFGNKTEATSDETPQA